MEGETSVQVVIRVRPLLPFETNNKCKAILQYPMDKQILIPQSQSIDGSEKRFTYDYVFDEAVSQADVYASCVESLVENYLKGYNATILAYGQTGSGKTHTMGTAVSTTGKCLSEQGTFLEGTDGEAAAPQLRGSDTNQESSQGAKQTPAQGSLLVEGHGIIPRVITHIFDAIQRQSEEVEHEVKVSFLEIYNDQLHDLLAAPRASSSISIPTGAGDLDIRQLPSGAIHVVGAVEEPVTSAQQMMQCLERGSLSRTTGSTAMNQTSSRSHAIFSVMLTQRKKGIKSAREPGENEAEVDDGDDIISSKFHFVDLAGSERLKRTGAVGARMKEGISINGGLLALANVIAALADKREHVPFRDSKITRMLQDSLGGNSQTIMIACVSPADVNADETVNTLRYANRARNIQNKPHINRDPNLEKIAKMRSRIRELEAALAIQGGSLPTASTTSVSSEELALLRDQAAIYEREMRRAESKLKEARAKLAVVEDRAVSAEKERDLLKLKLQAGGGAVDEKVADMVTEQRTAIIALNELCASLKKELFLKQFTVDRYIKLHGTLPMVSMPPMPSSPPLASFEPSSPGAEDVDLDKLASLGGEISEEAEGLKLLSVLKEREHSLRLQELQRAQGNIETDIKEKTALLQSLQKGRTEDSSAVNCRDKVDQAEVEILNLTKQRDGLQSEVDKGKVGNQAQLDLIARLNMKLKEAQKTLTKHKDLLKTKETLQARLSKDEMKIQQLNSEIQKAKKQKVDLEKQISEKTEQYREWMKEKDNKLKSMAKDARKQDLLLAKAQAQLLGQAAQLKRKDEEKNMLQAQLTRQQQLTKNAQAVREVGKKQKDWTNGPKMVGPLPAAPASSAMRSLALGKRPGSSSSSGSGSGSGAGSGSGSSSGSGAGLGMAVVPAAVPHAPITSITAASVKVAAPLRVPGGAMIKKAGSFDKVNSSTVNQTKAPLKSLDVNQSKVVDDSMLEKTSTIELPAVKTSTGVTTVEDLMINLPAKRGSQSSDSGEGDDSDDDERGGGKRRAITGSLDLAERIQKKEADILAIFNTGDAKKLQKLPKIGPKRAETIIGRRDPAQPWQNIADVLKLIKFKNPPHIYVREMVMEELWDKENDTTLTIQ